MKDDAVYLRYMFKTARQVQTRVVSLSRREFDQDEDMQLALTHLLQTIGEAARMGSELERSKYPSLPWRQIVGMRHRIVHEYFNLDLDAVWDTSINRMQELIDAFSPVFDNPASPSTEL
jgi:uncharacterized protein with HEPN domain